MGFQLINFGACFSTYRLYYVGSESFFYQNVYNVFTYPLDLLSVEHVINNVFPFVECHKMFEKLSDVTHHGGHRRTDLQTVTKCKDACLQSVENCVAVSFKNGDCRLHYNGTHDNVLIRSYGTIHYVLVPANGKPCPKK